MKKPWNKPQVTSRPNPERRLLKRAAPLLLGLVVLLALGLAFSAEAADPPLWIVPYGGRVYQQGIAGGRLPDGGAAPVLLDSQGRVMTTASSPTCSVVTIRATSCGTTPLAVPVSRAAGSTSLEIQNSPENAGSPKVKCVVDPSDGGVGFGGTVAGLVRVPGESMFFALDSTHTVICVCDTAGTALVSSECTP